MLDTKSLAHFDFATLCLVCESTGLFRAVGAKDVGQLDNVFGNSSNGKITIVFLIVQNQCGQEGGCRASRELQFVGTPGPVGAPRA